MSIDDKVSEKKRLFLDETISSIVGFSGGVAGTIIGFGLGGPIGAALGTFVGDILGHFFGFSVPWYVQHRDKGIYQNIKDLAGKHVNHILPYIGHSLIGGALSYVGTAFTPFSPVVVGTGAEIISELAYTGMAYLANVPSLEKKSSNESYKTPNTIPYSQPQTT